MKGKMRVSPASSALFRCSAQHNQLNTTRVITSPSLHRDGHRVASSLTLSRRFQRRFPGQIRKEASEYRDTSIPRFQEARPQPPQWRHATVPAHEGPRWNRSFLQREPVDLNSSSNKFRIKHLVDSLHGWEKATNIAGDTYMKKFFESRPVLGANDRRFLSETFFQLLRWQSVLDWGVENPTWETRLAALRQTDLLNAKKQDVSIPSYIRYTFPKPLFDRLASFYGEQTTEDIMRVSNERAPVTLRVNRLKQSRDTWIKANSTLTPMEPCPEAEHGVRILDKIDVLHHPDYKNRIIEVQDEASQLVSQKIQLSPGDEFLDYCCGAGGKSLAIGIKGASLWLVDVRPSVLWNVYKRMDGCGIDNYSAHLKDDFLKLQRKRNVLFDWIIVDVPCSGLGRIRRSPELKYQLTDEKLDHYIKLQREIFDEAQAFLTPGGKIVYATCSILPEENEQQISYFANKYPNLQAEPNQNFLRLLPVSNGHDGAFAATLTAKK